MMSEKAIMVMSMRIMLQPILLEGATYNTQATHLFMEICWLGPSISDRSEPTTMLQALSRSLG
jgi:hypothetical protein